VALAAVTAIILGALGATQGAAQPCIHGVICPTEPTPSLSPSPSPSASPSSGDATSSPTQPPGTEPQPQPGLGPTPGRPGSATDPAGALPELVVPNIARTPARSTENLLDILTPLSDRGIPLEQMVVLASAPFPVAGLATYSHDFGFPRYVPFPHLHEGTDIFADFGTPIVASSPGAIAGIGDQTIGGNSIWISSDDGNGYYYTHLLGFAEGLYVGQRVEAGTVIGYVGNSGNAATTPPHVHFEIHPPVMDAKGKKMIAGGARTLANGQGSTNTPAADPKATLDMWLKQAEANAQTMVVELGQKLQSVSRELHFSNRVDSLFVMETRDRPTELVMFSVLEPTLGAMGLARQAAALNALATSSGSFSQRTYEERRFSALVQTLQAPQIALSKLTGLTPLFL